MIIRWLDKDILFIHQAQKELYKEVHLNIFFICLSQMNTEASLWGSKD